MISTTPNPAIPAIRRVVPVNQPCGATAQALRWPTCDRVVFARAVVRADERRTANG
jgi:hypothetical protein